MRWPTCVNGEVYDWFAWRPVVVGDEWVWLETVQRIHQCRLMGCLSIVLTPVQAAEYREYYGEQAEARRRRSREGTGAESMIDLSGTERRAQCSDDPAELWEIVKDLVAEVRRLTKNRDEWIALCERLTGHTIMTTNATSVHLVSPPEESE